ncbi:MAG: ABC transporter ATP-binding protein [Oscillospiraceae bacterium]|jgi:putative ABC transport system ATP-binding protein|nr:ABC transporter ATP-binding protein [Oscillospiraceae bacterium]
MSELAIQVKHVSKEFGVGDAKVSVLRDVSFEVGRGEFVSVMGASGSGKSTLLYLIGTLDRVTGGDIWVNGRNIREMRDAEKSALRRNMVGFVFQFYNLIPNLTVEENILLPAVLDGKRPGQMKGALAQILQTVGLSDRKKHFPRELSGGQQQRTAIARALIGQPDIIFADEPTGNLDSKTGEGVMQLLRSVNRELGKTIVMVTHSVESAACGTRILHIRDGAIVKDERLAH